MSNFKGTKGDWEFRPPSVRFDACTVCDGKIIGYASKNTPEDIANEKLRAAAPELLEALELIMTVSMDHAIIRIANKAIKKALGQ